MQTTSIVQLPLISSFTQSLIQPTKLAINEQLSKESPVSIRLKTGNILQFKQNKNFYIALSYPRASYSSKLLDCHVLSKGIKLEK